MSLTLSVLRIGRQGLVQCTAETVRTLQASGSASVIPQAITYHAFVRVVAEDAPLPPVMSDALREEQRETERALHECVIVQTGGTRDAPLASMRLLVGDQLIEHVCLGDVRKLVDVPDAAILHPVPLLADVPLLPKLPRHDVVYARCERSMEWLDGVYRDYIINRHKFSSRSVAVRAVAGSGKTTALIKLAKRLQRTDPMGTQTLYVAFNRQLVTEIKGRLQSEQLHRSMQPMTFDALVKRVAERRFAEAGRDFPFTGALTVYELTKRYEWFRGKSHKVKKATIDNFAAFCQDVNATVPVKTWTRQLWEDTQAGKLLTFDGLRKRAHMEHWMRGVLDERYARIFVDEAQDFDPLMLDILKRDVTVPKLFVGDARQQIYEWRGTINAFEHLPENTLVFEFYRTFRMGNPGVREIAAHTGVSMIAGTQEARTRLHRVTRHDTVKCPSVPYTYLFRSWRALLTSGTRLATELAPDQRIWVYDFDRQMANIENHHDKILRFGGNAKQSSFDQDDDMPAFLMKLDKSQLLALKESIVRLSTPNPSEAFCKLYTIHSFKGLEDDVVRVADDAHPTNEPNLYYVALTRARKEMWVDPVVEDRKGDRKDWGRNGPRSERVHKDDLPTILHPHLAPPNRHAHALAQPSQMSATDHATDSLHAALTAFRADTAREKQVPAYCVLNNKTLENIVRDCPQSLVALGRVHGIGARKVADYGVGLVALCKAWGSDARANAASADALISSASASDAREDVATELIARQSLPMVRQDDEPFLWVPNANARSNAAATGVRLNSANRVRDFVARVHAGADNTGQGTANGCGTAPPSKKPRATRTPKYSVPQGELHVPTDRPLLFLCYDLETTGLYPRTDAITQICIQLHLYTPSSRTLTHLHTITTFVHTRRPIPDKVQELTSIRPHDVLTAPRFPETAERLANYVEEARKAHGIVDCVWVAHNGFGFDCVFLARYLRWYACEALLTTAHPSLQFWCADTLVMFKAWVAVRCPPTPPKNMKLETLFAYVMHHAADVGCKDVGAEALSFHRADADVHAMVAVLRYLVRHDEGVMLRHVVPDSAFMARWASAPTIGEEVVVADQLG